MQGIDRESLSLLAESLRVEPNNIILTQELKERIDIIYQHRRSSYALIEGCAIGAQKSILDIYETSGWYLFEHEVTTDLEKGAYGGLKEVIPDEICSAISNYNPEELNSAISQSWQLESIVEVTQFIDPSYVKKIPNKYEDVFTIRDSNFSVIPTINEYGRNMWDAIGPKDIGVGIFDFKLLENVPNLIKKDRLFSIENKKHEKRKFWIQVGAFSSKSNAQNLNDKLLDLGYLAYMLYTSVDNNFRVIVGPYRSIKLANKAAKRLEEIDGISREY